MTGVGEKPEWVGDFLLSAGRTVVFCSLPAGGVTKDDAPRRDRR